MSKERKREPDKPEVRRELTEEERQEIFRRRHEFWWGKSRSRAEQGKEK